MLSWNQTASPQKAGKLAFTRTTSAITEASFFWKPWGYPKRHAHAISEAYVCHYPGVYAPVDGAIEIIKTASRLFKTSVISNSMPDVQYQKLETLGIHDLFMCIVIATEIKLKKPDPNIFQYTADLLQIKVSDCLSGILTKMMFAARKERA